MLMGMKPEIVVDMIVVFGVVDVIIIVLSILVGAGVVVLGGLNYDRKLIELGGLIF